MADTPGSGIDRRSGVPLRLQLASIFRERIRSGQLPPGAQTPSGPALADEYVVSRYTADRALDLLASEGLVRRVAGQGTIVVGGVPAREVVEVPPGCKVTARLPGAEEHELLIPPGVPVLVISYPGGAEQVYPADRVIMVAVETGAPRPRGKRKASGPSKRPALATT